MNYKLVFTDKAKKQLKKLDKHTAALIIGWLEKNIEIVKIQGYMVKA